MGDTWLVRSRFSNGPWHYLSKFSIFTFATVPEQSKAYRFDSKHAADVVAQHLRNWWVPMAVRIVRLVPKPKHARRK